MATAVPDSDERTDAALLSPDDIGFSRALLRDYLKRLADVSPGLELRAEKCLCQDFSVGADPTGIPLSTVDERQRSERWLSWARSQSTELLRVRSSQVPAGILPKELDASLVDVRVSINAKNKGGPPGDDAIYAENAEIRAKVARGNCFLEYRDINNGQRTAACVVYGLKKFTGGLGDDDEDGTVPGKSSLGWTKFFTKPLSEIRSVVLTDKVNGESAHMSVRQINGEFVIFAGSKNVHLVFVKEDDIERYDKGQFLVARTAARAVCALLHSLTAEQKVMFLGFMAHTRYTAIFEMLQPSYQHVEDISHLERPLLVFICWASCLEASGNEDGLCAVEPAAAVQLARAFGLSTINCEEIGLQALDRSLRKIRLCHGTEGKVLYFLDSQRQVVGLLKRKTMWYICVRAIREKTKTAVRVFLQDEPEHQKSRTGESRPKKAFSLHSVGQKITRRFEQLQKWLEFDDQCRQHWQKLALSFVGWVVEGISRGTLEKEQVRCVFPTVWKRFLRETQSSDQIVAHLPVQDEAAAAFGLKSSSGSSADPLVAAATKHLQEECSISATTQSTATSSQSGQQPCASSSDGRLLAGYVQSAAGCYDNDEDGASDQGDEAISSQSD